MSNVLLGMPTRDGGRCYTAALLHAQWAMVEADKAGIKCQLHCEEFACATLARNWFADLALSAKFSHLLFVDDDTLIPRDTIVRLLALDADIATGITPIGNDPPMTNVQRVRGEFLPCWPTGCFDVETCGTSCMLIRTDVFEKLEWPWFSYYQARGHKNAMSEDLPFCIAARDAGLTLRCDASVVCGHLKQIDLRRLCPPMAMTANMKALA